MTVYRQSSVYDKNLHLIFISATNTEVNIDKNLAVKSMVC